MIGSGMATDEGTVTEGLGTLAATSVAHTLRGRVRLRVPALKTSTDLARRLERLLRDQPGVFEITVNNWCASLTVIYDPSVWTSDRFCAWLQHLSAEEVAAYKPLNEPVDQAPILTEEVAGPELWFSSVGIGIALLVEPLAPLVPLLLVSALPMLTRAYRSIADNGQVNIDVLDATATSLLVVQGNFPIAIYLVWAINVGDWIRSLTMMKAKEAIMTSVEEILGHRNIEAWVVRGGQTIRVSVEQIQLGETVVIYPGERIAVDGTVLIGRGLVDQAELTGKSVLVEKEEGSSVSATMVVRGGTLYIRAERIGTETEAAQILRLVEAAPTGETKIQDYAVKWANDLVPFSFAGGGVNAVLDGGLQGAASVLIADYGTGIRISAPIAVLSAMSKAIRNGILIKGGRYLENLAEVDAVVFDKTGTLTTEHPDLLEVVPCASSMAEEVLALAAAAELRLTHPVADAVVRAAKARDLSIPERTALEYSLGLGVEAVVDTSVILVGGLRFMKQRGLTLSREVRRAISQIQRQGISPLCVARDGSIIGLLSISAPLRPEARDVVQALRQRGIKHIAMLTGDHQDVAKRVAADLGITEHEAELLPADKAEAVQRLQRQGYKVAVVGDGINDCPMLAYADVGIAVEGGAVAVRNTAPVVLLNGGIGKLPAAIDIGRATVALIRQNWTITSIPNTIAIGLASVGMLGTIGASLLSDGSSIIAMMNSLRPIMENEVGERGESDTLPGRDPVRLPGSPE